ncbi:MAG: MFS transporter [Alteripontixanthobacter sp.]
MAAPSPPLPRDAPSRLTRRQEFLLAAAGAVIVANAYYIHPIIAEVARGFGVGEARIGLVPALNQLALALGVLVLLPLGDRISNRRLLIASAVMQTAAMLVMALADGFWLFTAGSTLLGFFTIGPYLLPAYASKRVSADRLGQVTATLTVGTIVGILVARIAAGVIARYLEWEHVYWLGAGLMVAVTLALPLVMEGRRTGSGDAPRQSYGALVYSTLPLLLRHRQVALSGLIQALNFGIFLSVWLGLGFHLTSGAMGYGTDVVGYLAGLAIVSMFVTPKLGKYADRIGAERARLHTSAIQFAGVALLYPLGFDLWLLVIPIIVLNAVGPAIDVSGRMTSLALAPEIRTRLMTGYIVLMFAGAGLASWGGTAAYGAAGWAGVTALAAVMSAAVVALSWLATRIDWDKNGAPDRI